MLFRMKQLYINTYFNINSHKINQATRMLLFLKGSQCCFLKEYHKILITLKCMLKTAVGPF